MTSFDPAIAEALDRALPTRPELAPAWDDVLARAHPQPAKRRRAILISRRVVVAALALLVAALILGGLAIAGAFAPLHQATLVVSPNTLTAADGTSLSTCGLIGERAERVAARLASSGITVQWRFMHWGTTTASTPAGSPTAVTGGRSDAVASVPPDSIVWDIVPGPNAAHAAFVFAEAPNDPTAPTVSTVNCTG